MATSTFGRKFSVTPSKAAEFVNEMTKAVTPTLPTNFQSNLVNLSQDKVLKSNLMKALNK